MQGIAEISKESIAIENYIKTLNAGENVFYETVEKETGVEMNLRGKALLRGALKRLSLEYTPMSAPNTGKGYVLADANNASSIVVAKVLKVDRGIQRTHRTAEKLKNQFQDQLNDVDKNIIDTIHVQTGTMLAIARVATKGIYARKTIKAINI